MNIKNISKKNSVFSKLGFGWVQTMAVLVVMGMVLSCGSDDPTAPPVVDLTPTGLESTVTPTKVELEWDIVEGANFYWVFYTETTGGPEVTNRADTNEFATPDTLTPGTEYRFEVQACNNSKCSARVGLTLRTTLVATPIGLKYTEVTSTKVALGWTAVEEATFYRVFYTNITEGVPQVSNQVNTSDFATGDNALTANNKYKFEVEACNDMGCSSRSALTVITRPNRPDNFDFVREENTSTSLSLTWKAPTGGATYYTLYRDSGVGEKITGLSKSVTGLEPDTEYSFDLVACNEIDLCSDKKMLKVITPPAKVTDLVVGESGGSSITIRWTPSKGTTSYVLKVGDKEVDSPAGNTNQFEIRDLQPSSKYTFSLQACNEGGCSDPVMVPGETTDNITAIPATPEGLTNTKVSTTVVELDWESPEQATSYRVFYTNITAGGPEVSNQVDTSDFTTSNLIANTQYKFEVEACNRLDCSSRSTLTLTTAPPAPADLKAVDIGYRSVGLSWTPSTGATHYVIDNGDTKFTNDDGNSGTYRFVLTLKGGTRYTFKVVACNAFGCSDESEVIYTTALEFTSNVDYERESVTSTSMTVFWNKVEGATGYIIYASYSSYEHFFTNDGHENTRATLEGLRYDTYYTIRVMSCTEGFSLCTKRDASPHYVTAYTAPHIFLLETRNPTVSTIELLWDSDLNTSSVDKVYYVIDTGTSKVTNTEYQNFSYTVTNLEPGTTHTFKVKVCTTNRACSQEFETTGTTLPNAPGGFTHEGVTSTSVSLKWDAVTGAKSYVLYQGDDVVFTSDGDSPATTYTVTGLDASTEYTFYVVACAGDGSTLCSAKTEHKVTTAAQ